LAFLPGLPPKSVSDRAGYVQARVDYLNYLFSSNAYLATSADNAQLAPMQLLIPRIIVLLRTDGADDPPAFQHAIKGGAVSAARLGRRATDMSFDISGRRTVPL